MMVYVLWELNLTNGEEKLVNIYHDWETAEDDVKFFELCDYAGYYDYWIECWDVK